MNCLYVYFAVVFIGAHAGVISFDEISRQPIVILLEPGNWTESSNYGNEVCENGWMRFEGSCIFTEREEKATFEEAKNECEKKNAKLWTPKSEEEYKSVMAFTPIYSYTWTGISKKNDEAEPKWQAETNFDYEKMYWLIKPYSAALNGFSSISQCVGFYRGNFNGLKYTYFYPCEWNFYYICEKESPLVPYE